MNYRPDIDGLRAIAIIFVLMFHAGLSLFPSGFVGVDIFFVISGFLITNIIQNGIKNKNFSFSEFYSRRLWRLQPVFICLIIVLLVVSFIYLLPDDLVAFSKSARKTTIFTSNVFFKNFTGNYFAPNTNELPLLHMWSLSIEWQCYLLLPLGIYLLHKIGPKSRSKLLYIVTLFFLLVSMYFSWASPTQTYYQLVSRIFEFLIGACIASRKNERPINKTLLNSLTLASIGIIFYIATRQGIHSDFPNWHAFFLCGATALLIFAGQQADKSLVTNLLSFRPLVSIGLISYSLYLWHWLILAVSHYLNVVQTSKVLFIIFLGIFIIAYLSWRYIEKPARQYHQIKFTYTLMLLLITPILSIHVLDYFIKKNQGYLSRFKDLGPIQEVLNQYNYPQRSVCLESKSTNLNPNCLLGSEQLNSAKGLMIGDSFSNHFWGFIDRLAKDANISILSHSAPSCLALPGIAEIDWFDKNKIYDKCYELNQHYYEMIKINHFDYVILGENWEGYLGDKIINNESDERSLSLSKQRIQVALEEAITLIIASGARPVVVQAVALSAKNSYSCFYEHIKRREKYDSKRCTYINASQTQQWFNNLFATLQDKYKPLIVIDPKVIQCLNGKCQADINGVPLFRDDIHITDYASYQWGEMYLKKYKNPLA